MQSNSLITIITPSLNGAAYIAEAIESVLAQGDPKVEHIVVDGGSTDGTLDILENYPHLRVICEADKGVYDALNKGIRAARGEIIGWLNTDDYYDPNVFGEVAGRFAEDAEIDMVYGGATIFCEQPSGARKVLYTYNTSSEVELSLRNVTLGVPIVNARFFRRRLYERIGAYDARYALAGDRKFLLRVLLAGVKASPLDRIVYHYRSHDKSLTIPGTTAARGILAVEYMEIAEEYIEKPGLRSNLRSGLRLWHSREASVAALVSLIQRDLPNAGRHIRRGWRHDHRWPLRFLVLIVVLVWRRFWRRAAGGQIEAAAHAQAAAATFAKNQE